MKDKILKLETSKKKEETDKIQCSYCDFKTMSKQGLKTHMKRKHTAYDLESYPLKCELCETELTNSEEMKEHMVTHT